MTSGNLQQSYLESLKLQQLQKQSAQAQQQAAYAAQLNGPSAMQGNLQPMAQIPQAQMAQNIPRAGIPGGPIGYLPPAQGVGSAAPDQQALTNLGINPYSATSYSNSVARGQAILDQSRSMIGGTPDRRYLNPQTDQVETMGSPSGINWTTGNAQRGLLQNAAQQVPTPSAQPTNGQPGMQQQGAQAQGMFGSPEFMNQLAQVYQALPEDKRSIFDNIVGQVQSHIGGLGQQSGGYGG